MAKRTNIPYGPGARANAVGGAYEGLKDYPSLLAQSNQTYDLAAKQISDANFAHPDINNAQALIDNARAKMAPTAPFFQALDNAGVGRVGQDTARPHGIADDPEWWMQGDVGASAQLPIAPVPDSTNIATPNPTPTAGRLKSALRGLRK